MRKLTSVELSQSFLKKSLSTLLRRDKHLQRIEHLILALDSFNIISGNSTVRNLFHFRQLLGTLILTFGYYQWATPFTQVGVLLDFRFLKSLGRK